MLTAVEEEKLIASAKQGNDRSKAVLLTAFRPLVLKMAMRRRGFGIPLEDLVSEGMIGLLLALRKFDAANGNRFGTYAKWWVMAQIDAFTYRNWSAVTRGDGRKAKIRYVYHEIGAAGWDQSLNFRPAGPDSDFDLSDKLVDDRPLQDDVMGERVAFAKAKAELVARMALLKPRTRAVLMARWPEEGEAETLEEISLRYGVTKERVRQIEVDGLARIGATRLMHKPKTMRQNGLAKPAKRRMVRVDRTKASRTNPWQTATTAISP